TDPATGRPPRRAAVVYYPLRPNPHSAALTTAGWMAPASASVRPDGSYGLVVLPGPGILLVAASPRDSYASAGLGGAVLGQDGGGRVAVGRLTDARVIERYNAVALIHAEDGAEPLSLDLTVHPARSVRGTVVGPDGPPLAGVRVSGLTAANDTETLEGTAFTVEGLHPRG